MPASPWNTVLTAAEIDARYALTASIDPRFARGARAHYGHFDHDYAAGYNLGLWEDEPPPYALTGQPKEQD